MNTPDNLNSTPASASHSPPTPASIPHLPAAAPDSIVISSIAQYLSAHNQIPFDEPLSHQSSSLDTPIPLADAKIASAGLLRRKPNLEAGSLEQQSRSQLQTDSPRPQSPGIPLPPVHSAPDVDDRPSTAVTTVLTRSRSHSAVAKSPTRRKPPASHSSYGVETSLGPPPSYTTQRTLSQDRVWKLESSQRQPNPPQKSHHAPIPQEPDDLVDDSIAVKEQSGEVSSPDTLETQSIPTPSTEDMADATPQMADYSFSAHDDAEDRSRTLRAYGITATDADSKESSGDDRKSEDLFLNIARADGNRQPPQGGVEKRTSRISLPFLPSTRARDGAKVHPSNLRTDFDPSLLSPQSDTRLYYDSRLSLGQQTITASSAHPVEAHSRPSTRSGISRTTSRVTRSVLARDDHDNLGEPNRGHSRQTSHTTNELGGRPIHRSSLGSRGQRLISDSHATERPRYGDLNATESTISTTAPSTVWDELDDLKSRIRKLELTGKLPPSSAAAMSSAERPRTATTAATTLSSSPKNKQNMLSLQSAIEGIPSSIHPLLHEALGQAKPVLSNEVYQKLQATASDALQLVALMNGDSYQASSASVAGYGISQERQIRRRAESMCRGLTELTIAMSAESKASQSPSYRPASRDVSTTQPYPLASRRLSNEAPDLPPVASRIQSRLDTRRTSLHLANARTGHSSPESSVQTPSIIPSRQPGSSGNVQRTSPLLRPRRTAAYVDGVTDDDDDRASSVRPVSRARTELGSGNRRSARDRTSLSREYTSQHPMPTQLELSTTQRSQLPAGLGSNFQSRRKYYSPASTVRVQGSSPVTPGGTFGRITVVGREMSSAEVTPDTTTPGRGLTPRKSLGLASRIGSSVGSRLRAVRAERNASARDQKQPSSKEVSPSIQDVENTNYEEERV